MSTHSKMVQTRRRKQKGKRQLANLATQAKKLKDDKLPAADPRVPQGTAA